MLIRSAGRGAFVAIGWLFLPACDVDAFKTPCKTLRKNTRTQFKSVRRLPIKRHNMPAVGPDSLLYALAGTDVQGPILA